MEPMLYLYNSVDRYRGNIYGLPDNSDDANNGSDIPYFQQFEKPILDKKIVSCPNGYNICYDNSSLCCSTLNNNRCVPIETGIIIGSRWKYCDTNTLTPTKPETIRFRSERQCMNWCASNPECKAMVSYIDRDGKTQCKYYKYSLKDNRIKMVDDNMSKIFEKRVNPYPTNFPKNLLPLNNCGEYGCCADGIMMSNKDGTNCRPYTKESELVDKNINKSRTKTGNAFINY